MRFKKLVDVLADGIGSIAVTEYTDTEEKVYVLRIPTKGQTALMSLVFGMSDRVLQKFAEFRVDAVFIEGNKNLVHLDPVDFTDIVSTMRELAVIYKGTGLEFEIKSFPLELKTEPESEPENQ